MMIHILLKTQELLLIKNNQILKKYSISSAKKGAGEEYGSQKTPRGWHIIRAKIGKNCPENTVFVKRRPTGEIYSERLDQLFPERDWILTRILWLSGLELEKNRLGNVDSMRRKIYIHGSPDHKINGVPDSHGCIRMHNHDIIELFDEIHPGTKVLIEE